MFKKKFTQFIDIIKYDNQIKLNYRKIEDGDVSSKEQKTFLQNDEILPHDVSYKINSWRKDREKETFVSALLSSKEQQVFKKSSNVDLSEYKTAELNDNSIIAIKNHLLFETKHYFHETVIDRLFSPFHILNLYREKNESNNNLLVFIYDNLLYICITGNKNEIVFSTVEEMIKFDEIKNSEFYDDELEEQKGFDELYSFAFTEKLNTIIKKFYEEYLDIFIQKVTILYNVKYLSDEDIDELENELMIGVNNYGISLDNYLFELSKAEDSDKKSLIKTQKKDNSNTKIVGAFFAITLLIGAGLVYYFKVYEPNLLNKQTNKTIQKVQPNNKKLDVNTTASNLPQHIKLNRDIAKRVLREFDIIPYNAVLKEVEFKEDSSKVILDLLKKDTYVVDILPTLSMIYKNTSINYDDKNDTVLHGVIENSGLNEMKSSLKDIPVEYIIDDKLTPDDISEQLKNTFNKETIITYYTMLSKNGIDTYIFKLSTIISSPLEFYELVEELNKELYSIVIDYPVNFRKSALGIEVEFVIKFNQI